MEKSELLEKELPKRNNLAKWLKNNPRGYWHGKKRTGLFTEESRLKLRQSRLGKKLSEETKLKVSEARLKLKQQRGFLNSKETREKISKALAGRSNPNLHMFGKIAWNRGLKGFLAGEKHHWWKGGITPINLKIRQSIEYKQWRKAVFERDNYTCVQCGDSRGGNLNADHIKPFAYYPELRFELTNGRTLCVDCHKKTDTYLEKAYKYKLCQT